MSISRMLVYIIVFVSSFLVSLSCLFYYGSQVINNLTLLVLSGGEPGGSDQL